ncbi:MAG TPA: hypothetical protein VKE74_06575 [Gemmataceae bacterium]|nr:hypothetical protein [Gemmataceae bacterium]
MEDPHELFTAMEVRDAIGMLADGYPIEPGLIPFVRAAVAGLCPTADRGEQQFVVDVSGCGLFKVDTEPEGMGRVRVARPVPLSKRLGAWR